MLLMFAIIALVGILLIFLRYSLWRKKCCKLLPCKTPGFFNVFGNLIELWLSSRVTGDIHIDFLKLLMERIKLFNEEKVMCFWALYEPFVFLTKAESVKDLLKGSKMNDKGWVYEWMQFAFGTGLVTSSGAKAKIRRRLLMPCFHPDILRKYWTVFNEKSEKLVQVLQAETKKEFSCIENPIALCTIDIMMETMFGVQFDSLESGNSEYMTFTKRGEDIVLSRFYKPWQWPSFIFWNSKTGKELKQLQSVLHRIARRMIQDKKESYLRGEKESQSTKYKAFMDLLLEKHFETQEMSEEDIEEEVNTFAMAGHETTSTSVKWALYLIGLYPDVQAKIHEEIDHIFGEDLQRPVTEMDVRDLKYFDCALKECARLYPAIPLIGRQVTKDIDICNYRIPKGAVCIVCLYILHRDSDIFPDPEEFKPERFFPQNSINIPEHAYIPFSAGPRSCIGYKFADMEVKTIMCWILRKFTIESIDSREEVQPMMKLSLHSSVPIRLRIRTRSAQKF